MRHYLLFSVSICISLMSLHAQVISTAHFRNLNSGTSHNQKANIEIPINAEAADYHFSSFDDPSIFYCEKTLGALGVNDICQLQSSNLNIAKSLAVTNLASPFFVGAENILSVSGNLLVVHGIQTDLERPRAQIIASLALNPKNENRKIDSVSFHMPNQQIAVLHGTKIEFYNIDGVNLDFQVEIESPVSNITNLQDKQIFYFLNKFVFIFDKEAQKLFIYTLKNLVLTHLRTTENVQELFLDTKLAFIFTKDKLYTMDGENEVAVDFDRQVKGVIKASSTGVFVFSESRKDKKESASIQYVEIFEKKGFRINVIFTCPRGLKAMYLTTKNMYLVYENWVRIYPTVKDIQFNGEFFFDFVLSSPLAGVINTKAHDYLAIADQDNQVTLFSNDRTEFGLECKKEKGTAVAEYLFQIRCYTMKCDNVDFSAQKFANGSCAYTKNIMITPEEESGTFGTVLLVGLGLIAGIAITIGFGAINCFGKVSEDQNVKTHAPKAKDKKPFNINRGLRRPSYTPSHHNQSHVSQFSHTNETRKFLHEGDESYPSEDMRESVQAMMNMKKKNTPMFETPRFTSFGGGISASLPVSANHAKHLENVNEPEGEGSHLTKGSQDDENDQEETGDSGENKKPVVKMEKLKLGVFQNKFPDPTSFRNIGAPQNTNPSPDKKMEKEDGSKYSELQDENEEDEEEDDEENENVKIDSGSGGEYMEGSFSK